MISFSESLNNPYKVKFEGIERSDSDIVYPGWFDADSGSYYFMAIADLKTKTIRIDFSDEDGEAEISGLAGKDAFRVFASVVEAVKLVLKHHAGFSVKFAGNKDEPSRVRLYDQIAKRVSASLNGHVERFQGPRNVIWMIHQKK